MQVRCIKPFGTAQPAHTDDEGNEVPATVAEVPDGAAVDPQHWEPAETPPPRPPGPRPMQNPEAAAARLLHATRWPASGTAQPKEL